jgi:hypothetical protein
MPFIFYTIFLDGVDIDILPLQWDVPERWKFVSQSIVFFAASLGKTLRLSIHSSFLLVEANFLFLTALFYAESINCKDISTSFLS